MKHINFEQQKNCIFKPSDEFENDVKFALEELEPDKLIPNIVFNYDMDGWSAFFDDEDGEELNSEVLFKALKKYYQVDKIMSILVDDRDEVGVWICYKNEPQHIDNRQILSIEGGSLYCDVNKNEDYPGVDVEFVPDKDNPNNSCRPRVLFEAPEGKIENLRILVWDEPFSEDCSICLDFSDFNFKKGEQQ